VVDYLKSVSNVDELTTPGARLKYVRNLLRVSRSYIQDQYDLSADTLKAWENDKARLTEKGLNRCVEIYRKEGIELSKDWVLTGEGVDPKISVNFGKYINEIQATYKNSRVDDEALIFQEVEYFKKSSDNAVVMLVSSEEMLPYYAPGDYIGGRFKLLDTIEEALNKDCIVRTTKRVVCFRRLVKSADGKSYNLVCLNPLWGETQDPVLFNVDIECVAPVIWHRRIDK